MPPESVHSLLALSFGFAVAGLLATFYELVTTEPASFRLLSGRAQPSTLITLPFILLAAPFIIMRNTIRRHDTEAAGFGFAMLATMLAGFWSLASGGLVIEALESLRVLV